MRKQLLYFLWKNPKFENISHKKRISGKNFSLHVEMAKLDFLKLQLLHFYCNKNAIKQISDCNNYFHARKLQIWGRQIATNRQIGHFFLNAKFRIKFSAKISFAHDFPLLRKSESAIICRGDRDYYFLFHGKKAQ